MVFNSEWSIYLKALYYDHQGDWNKAHNLVDGTPGAEAAHIHAYLHRKEGDQWNARYWYSRAGVDEFSGTLEEEWTLLWNKFE